MEVLIIVVIILAVAMLVVLALFISGEIVSSRGIRKTFKDDDAIRKRNRDD